MDDDEGCPRCRTTRYRNPNLKLLVNVCGHSLCESCVEVLFVRGSGACPECNTALRRAQFRVQVFEDSSLEKEIDIRRKILRDFNKQEEDFQTLKEYNDYLEMVETFIFNLSNGIDVDSTKKEIDAYKRQNKEEIAKNKLRKSRDLMFLEQVINQERGEEAEKRHQLQYLEMKTENQKKRKKEAFLDELMASDAPAYQVLASHSQDTEEDSKESVLRGLKIGAGFASSFVPAPRVEETKYEYVALEVESFGPEVPHYQDLDSKGFSRHVRPASPQGLGGGYTHQLACHRALQEALSGLFFFAHRQASSER